MSKSGSGIKSMTSYARSTTGIEHGLITIDLKSVNHKFLDINFKSHLSLSGAQEYEIRKLVSANLLRGKVDLIIYKKTQGQAGDSLEQGAVLEKAFVDYTTAFNNLKAKYSGKQQLPEDSIVQIFLAALRQSLAVTGSSSNEITDEDFKALMQAIEEGCRGLVAMRTLEGKALCEDILAHVGRIEQLAGLISGNPDSQPEQVLSRLRVKIKALLSEQNLNIDETRLAQEAAMLVQRADFSEEIARIKSHLSQIRDLVSGQAASAGKKLDFLAQELNREITTTLAKCSNSEIANNGMEIKLSIEKIREQAQNIE